MAKAGSRSALRYWLPALAWMAAIVLLPRLLERPVQATLPEPEAQGGQLVRYLIHVVEYGVLALLLTRALRRTASFRGRALSPWGKSQGAALAIGLGFAVFDELQQGFMPHREPAVADLVADGLGILLALAAVACYRMIMATGLRKEPSS